MGLFDKWKEKMNEATKKDPMYQGTMVLLYNLPKEKGLQFEVMCESLGVQVVYVDKADYLQPLGALAEISGIERTDDVYEGEGFSEIMAVMKNFTGIAMVNFKDKMRRTNGVATFQLETTLHDKNINLNSIQVRDMLYAKKFPSKEEE